MIKKLYRTFCWFLYKIFNFSLSKAKLTLFLSILLFFIALFFTSRIQVELRMYDIEDPHFSSTHDLLDFAEEFNSGNSVLFIFHKSDGTKILNKDYCLIQSWLQNQKKQNPYIFSVLSPSDIVQGKIKDNHLIYQTRLKLNCASLSKESANEVIDFSNFQNSPWEKNVISSNSQDFIVQFTFQDSHNGSTDEKHFNPQWIGNLYEDLQQKILLKNPEISVKITGRSSFQWFQLQTLKKDLWVNGAITILFLFFFRLFLGTWLSGFIFFGTVFFSSTLTFGVMSLLKLPIDTLSNSLFPLLCIAGLEDFIFVSNRLQEKPKIWKHHFKKFMFPGFFTSFTTIIGFLSLALSDLAIIQRFGFSAAFAALMEWIITFFVLPSFLQLTKLAPYLVRPSSNTIQSFILKLNNWQPSKSFSKFAVFLSILSICSFPFLAFDMSPREYFPKSHAQSQAYDYTRSSRGWEAALNLVFNNRYYREKNEALLEKTKNLPNIASVENPYAYLDDMGQNLPPLFSDLVKREMRLSPFYRNLFSPWEKACATIYIKDFNLRTLNQTLHSIRDLCSLETTCNVVGEGLVFSEYSEKVVNSLFLSFTTCLFLTALIILFLAKSIGGSLKNFMPLLFSIFWAPFILIGLLALFRMPINYFNSMFATILTGLTGDNAIQYIFSAQRKPLYLGLTNRGSSSIIISLIASMTSLCFLFMTPLPLKNLGILLCLGFLASLFGDLWILKGLIKKP